MNHKSVRRFLFVLCLLALPFVRAENNEPSVPPLKRLANDQSEYRRFTLDNGIKVILLSDPKLNKSAASLAVGAGSLSDPRDRQGLAHFLEHMLFLGTEKYPDVNDYGNYLTSNGGYNNAYTADDHTNYLFEIRHEAFEGALDRFAQFFIAPLFTPEFTERELNAVNSENQKNLENDGWRAYQLRRSVYRADHPANHFGTGNSDTLAGVTREELLAFYNKHYSADRMTLALAGRAGLDQMEQWVRRYFSPVKNRDLGALRYDPDYLSPRAALRVVRIEPIADLRQISIEFPMPALGAEWRSKPAGLLGFIIGHEGEGSLLSQLKAEGLAISLGAGAHDETRDYGRFSISAQLTPAGLQNYQRVLELVFTAVAEIKRAGYPAYLFHERRTMAALDELYQDKGEGASRAVFLANQLAYYPLPIAERVPYLWLREDPAAFEKFLSYLRPDNMLVSITAKGVETDATEKYYGTKYSYREETGSAYDRLVAALGARALPEGVAIRIPAPNPYIPASAAVRSIAPARLIDEPGLSLYYAQDTEFQRPMVTQIFTFRLPRSFASLENAVALRFYASCLNEALNETTYVASEAGLDVRVSASLTGGVTITLNGYDESAARLLATVSSQLVDFKLDGERFAALKDRIVRGLRNFERGDAYRIAMTTLNSITGEFVYRPDEQIAAAEKMTLADVRAFARELYKTGKVEALIYGNVTGAEAVALARKFRSHKPAPESALLRDRYLEIAAGAEVRASEKLIVNNSAMVLRYKLGDTSPEMRAAAVALGIFVAEPFFTELRTRQQLGYIVSGGASSGKTESIAYFIIQSGNHPADELEKRALAFIGTLPGQLAALDDAAWAQIIAGARSRLEEKDKSIDERAGRLYALAYDYNADWERRAQTLAALDTLTKTRAVEILKNAFGEKTRGQVTVLAFSRDHEPADANAPKPTFDFEKRTEWKKTRSYK
ncbi:insulysin [Ereboglobus sp. PH5-10]|uniref:insulinase family protein n=1 Tax=Ereboglobus sp. PH5-10 TaxID=2940629 RepID=UPI0024054C15|nr:insulinase family protein [Ereboglobus sp. PH5-10]MDF9826393.1 insulysin [Ereboglobus sp. PH5-10]